MEYAYGQLEIDVETRKHWIWALFVKKNKHLLKFWKKFLRTGPELTFFRKKNRTGFKLQELYLTGRNGTCNARYKTRKIHQNENCIQKTQKLWLPRKEAPK